MSITIKNTKNEILEAFEEAKREIEKLKNLKYAPLETIKEKENTKIIASAVEDANNNLFSEEINQKLLNATKAIELQNERLKDLYDIEAELLDLTIIVNSKKIALDKLESEGLAKRESIQTEIDMLKLEFDDHKKFLEKQHNEFRLNLKTEREREIEEYNYNKKRQQEKDLDEWNDEKEKRELVIKEKEFEIQSRLNELDNKKEYIENLELQVSEFPTIIANAEEAAYKKGKSEAGKEYGYERSMYMKEAEYKEREYDNKISRLEEDLDRDRELNKSTNEKLDKAYSEIRDLANKTVEHTGSVKVIGGYNNETRK